MCGGKSKNSLEIYRALQRTLFMTHAQVPPVQGLIHEQGSVLQSIYQVLGLCSCYCIQED